ncbi:hypothetical protein D8M35_00695 [Curtobacterium sp. HSID17257]|nr:hypothetical protein D8M35_00695 [Curtobacterium sp. HSID17257]
MTFATWSRSHRGTEMPRPRGRAEYAAIRPCGSDDRDDTVGGVRLAGALLQTVLSGGSGATAELVPARALT